jgi:hypothetical protein
MLPWEQLLLSKSSQQVALVAAVAIKANLHGARFNQPRRNVNARHCPMQLPAINN